MKIIALYEGSYIVNKQKVFTPITPGMARVPGDGTKVGICPFLVEAGTDLILMDTGTGAERDGVNVVVSLIRQHGYRPEQVTHVLLSHFHKDHTNGIGSGATGIYTNAKIYAQRRGLEHALSQTNNPSFNQPALQQLQQLSNLQLLNEDKGQLSEHIFFEMDGGHCPFHQHFFIREGGETAFYGGDNLPQRYYLEHNWAYKNDADGKTAMHLREQWEQEARKAHWSVLFYHDTRDNVVQF
ncbi:MBL fold metallo-hydrolase [Chitinophaga horti]|uniref:MBL fold metallo-hydrolase n=1 Tax=Chitinophaga horti TaxID=2920382 RepID=A0ABY6J758_9BACT|nr:MBL fold metallo-hydrolase [Chitinophaga horti]UYQ95523.1 MBL fold metallo-hydrolase [Chitinophaga horti]